MESATQSFDTDDDLVVLPRTKDAGSKHEKRAFQKRRRSRACLACRTRKTKCDTPTTGPCSSCASASLLCKFSDETEDKRKVGPARRMRHLEATVQELTQKLEIAEGKLREKEEAASQSSKAASSASSLTPSAQSPPSKISPDVLDNQRRMSYNNKADADAAVRRGSTNRLVREKGSANTLFFGPTSGTGFVSSVKDFVERLGYQTATNWTQSESDVRFHSHPPSIRSEAAVDLRVYLPPRDTGEKLIAAYKNTIQKHLPNLYWPSAREKLNRAYDAPIHIADEPTVTGSFCFAMMVMAYGCVSLDPSDIPLVGGQDPSRRGWEYYERARQFHDLNKARYHIDDAIILTIMAIYLDGLALPSPAWMTVGSLARVCLDLGLHLNPEEPDMFTETQLEIRNRVFWGAYNLDRKLSIQFGRPPVLQEDEIDAELPGYYDAGGVVNDDYEYHEENKPVHRGIQLFRVVIQNSIASHSVLKLDPNLQNEDELEKSINEIDKKIVSYQKEAGSMYDIRDNEPLDPMVIKFLCHLLSARMSIHRFFTDTTLSHAFRTQCLIRSLEVGRLVVHILRRAIKWPKWETAFRHQQSELTYQVTTKTAIVFLLGYHLLERQVQLDAPGHIRICVEVLKEASSVRPTAKKGLEVIDNLASTLGFQMANSPLSRGDPTTTAAQEHYPVTTTVSGPPTTTAGAVAYHHGGGETARSYHGYGQTLMPPHHLPHVDPSLSGELSSPHLRQSPGELHWDNSKPWPSIAVVGPDAGPAVSPYTSGHVPHVQMHWPEAVNDVGWDIFTKVLGSPLGPSVDPSLMSGGQEQHEGGMD